MGLRIALPLFPQSAVVGCVVFSYQDLPEADPPLGEEVSSLLAKGNPLVFSHTTQGMQV